MDYVKHEVSSVPQEPDPQQLLPSFQFVPTRMQVTWTGACYGDSGPGAPGAGPYASAPAGVLRCPTPAAATRNGPRHRRRTWRRGRRAAPRFTPTVLRARLLQGANESPGGLRRRCPAWSPSQLSQVCGAQVTAPGKRENCKIVAAKSTPLKMAIILTFRVSNNPSGRLMRQPPLFLATSYPGHPWPFRGSQGSRTQVEEGCGRGRPLWTMLVHTHPRLAAGRPHGEHCGPVAKGQLLEPAEHVRDDPGTGPGSVVGQLCEAQP